MQGQSLKLVVDDVQRAFDRSGALGTRIRHLIEVPLLNLLGVKYQNPSTEEIK